MSEPYEVSLKQIIDQMSLEPVYVPQPPENVMITSSQVNRPGVELTGFFEFYDHTRILVFGNTEMTYLKQLDDKLRGSIMDELLSRRAPAIVLCRDFYPFREMLDSAKKYSIPILRSADQTSNFISGLVAYLNIQLAPRITRHGVLVEVYGEGIFLTGDSGVGKSETAIELVKRGHRLIADDAVEIRRVSTKTLVGTAPSNIRHFVELRGVGIIDARRIFGMGAIKQTEKLSLVINLEAWNSKKSYNILSMEDETTELLGINLPLITIPVKPGRNLAIIIEVAAMNFRQKLMGYNATHELLKRLGMGDDLPEHDKPVDMWDAYS